MEMTPAGSNRHRAEGRHFEMIAGKVIHADGGQRRFACQRMGPTATTVMPSTKKDRMPLVELRRDAARRSGPTIRTRCYR